MPSAPRFETSARPLQPEAPAKLSTSSEKHRRKKQNPRTNGPPITDTPAGLVSLQVQVSQVPMLLRCQRRDPAGSEPAVAGFPGTNHAQTVSRAKGLAFRAHQRSGVRYRAGPVQRCEKHRHRQTNAHNKQSTAVTAPMQTPRIKLELWPCSPFGAFLASFGRRELPAIVSI